MSLFPNCRKDRLFFETESFGADDKVSIQGVAFAEILAVKGS